MVSASGSLDRGSPDQILPQEVVHVFGAQTVVGSQQRRHFDWVPLDDVGEDGGYAPRHRQQFVRIAFENLRCNPV